MRSFTSTTSRPRIVTDIAPSPSTRESAFVRRTRSRSSLMALALLAELRRVRVLEAVHPHDVALDDGEVAQRLDAACGRARADRDQLRRCAPDLVNALDVLRGRHRALDYRQVVGTVDGRRRGFEEVRDLDAVGERQQLVLAVEDRQ